MEQGRITSRCFPTSCATALNYEPRFAKKSSEVIFKLRAWGCLKNYEESRTLDCKENSLMVQVKLLIPSSPMSTF